MSDFDSAPTTTSEGADRALASQLRSRVCRQLLDGGGKLQLPPGTVPVVYSAGYNISFMGLEKCHPFDAGKWGRTHQHLIESGLLRAGSSVEPAEAVGDEHLLLAHSKSYLNSLNWSAQVAMIMEVPFVACVPNALVRRYALHNFKLQTAGTLLATQLALATGWSVNLGGGFHHASRERGGGFCVYADISLAVKAALALGLVNAVAIVDLDAHQGNGHGRDFTGDSRVRILDVYNAGIYPGDTAAKAGIAHEVRLRHGTGDEQYMGLLRDALPKVLDGQVDLVVYNAGTDCLEGDPLGNLDITPKGIAQRDELVFAECRRRRIPIAMVLSGGYQRNNARVIADSLVNLHERGLIQLQ